MQSIRLTLCGFAASVLAAGMLAQSGAPAPAASGPQHTAPARLDAETPNAPAPQPSFPSTASPREGITVHGYWKIDIRNPDGSLVRHVEFENSLVGTQGAGAIGRALSGIFTNLGPFILVRGNASTSLAIANFPDPYTGYPDVQLPNISNTGPCGTLHGKGTDCVLTVTGSALYNNCLWEAAYQQAKDPNADPGYSADSCPAGLNAAVQLLSSSGSPVLELRDSFIAGSNAQIGLVATGLTLCGNEVLSTCTVPSTIGAKPAQGAVPYYMTSFSLNPEISVTTGQDVGVTVDLSFQ
jgi:hypothetical protein